MQQQPHAVDFVDRTNTIRIATRRQDGREVVTPIWGVVVDGVPYIRSGYGEKSNWYQRVQRDGVLSLVDGSRRYPATIENVSDENVIRQVDAAYETKYADEPDSLRPMLKTEAREFTMRLVPESERSG